MLIYLGAAFYARAAPAGASLYVSPAHGTFGIGSTFEVGVYVNTGGNSVNALRVDLAFPPDKLQIVSPSLGTSVIPFWVVQPTFSNSAGTIFFEGGVPPPGLNTSGGLISTVVFRVIGTGQATIGIRDSSRIYPADGNGAIVLGARADGLYQLKLPAPQGPRVAAPHQPDPNIWYQDDDAQFFWEMPSGAIAVSYVLSDDPLTLPDEISEGVRTSVFYQDLSPGTHYFHIKALSPDAGWGGSTHYQVNIDDDPPAEFNIEFNPSANTTVRRPVAVFATTDADSGISHYAIRVIPRTRPLAERSSQGESGSPAKPFFVEAASPFILPELEIGTYDVVARAYDAAGNYRDVQSRLRIRWGLFKDLGPEGISIRSNIALSWRAVYGFLGLLGCALLYAAHFVYRGHRELERKLAAGILDAVERRVSERLAIMRRKREEFDKDRLQ